MAKKILTGDEAKRAIIKGVDTLVDVVKCTLGPKGRNVLLANSIGAPLITNDGVSIAREIDLANEYENVGAQVIKQVCIKANTTAGDGTTTASVLAQSIISEGMRNTTAGANPIILRKGIEKAVKVAVEHIKQNSIIIKDKTAISQVATISAGDKAVGELIADTFEKVGADGVITIEEGRAVETELEIADGFLFARGYVSSYMCTDMDKMEAVLNSPYIFITDKRISNIQDILHIIESVSKVGRSLLIIADDIDSDALTTLVVNKMRGNINCVGVRAPSFGDKRKAILSDIAIATGGTFFSGDIVNDFAQVRVEDLGQARTVTVTSVNTTIIEGAGIEPKISERVNSLRKAITDETNIYEKEALQERLANLNGRVAIIKVGATTEIEMKEKKLRIEDALNATKAGIEEGIVAGGGTALLRAIKSVERLAKSLGGDERVGAMIVARALEQPIRQIAKNSAVDAGVVVERVIKNKNHNYGYDALCDKYVDMIEAGIIDPAKVVRSALQSAASVSAMLLTTECLVVEVAI